MIIIFAIGFIVSVVLLIITNANLQQLKQDKFEKFNEELTKQAAIRKHQLDTDYEHYEELCKLKCNSWEKQITAKEQHYNLLIKERESQLRQLENSKVQLKAAVQENIDKAIQEQVAAFNEGLQQYLEMTSSIQIDEQNQIEELQQQIDDYKQKQKVINDEILRRRAVAEQKDFYRIVLPIESIEDMACLNEVRQRLHNRVSLDKMLYDNYVAKPVKEMTKRVLSGGDPSGIYKITNMETNEIYVGKSTTVATRWANHVKAACGLDGVADSQFQRALKKYGIDKWTFELLEEVPKDKLTEREKYWISFYDSANTGYNQRVG